MYPPVNNFLSRAPETGSFLSQLLFHAGSDKFGISALVLTPIAASSGPIGDSLFSAYCTGPLINIKNPYIPGVDIALPGGRSSISGYRKLLMDFSLPKGIGKRK